MFAAVRTVTTGTDWGALLTGLAATIAALGALITSLRSRTQNKRTQASVQEVHELVNSHATAQEVRVDQLAAALTESGTEVPPRIPPTPPPPPVT